MADVQVDRIEHAITTSPKASCRAPTAESNNADGDALAGITETSTTASTCAVESKGDSKDQCEPHQNVVENPSTAGNADEMPRNGDFELLEKEDAVEKEDEEKNDGWMLVLGHNQLKKRTVKPGEPNSRPAKGQVVTVRCVGRLDDGTEVDKHENLRICLGDDDFISAFDLCLTLMDEGEICEIVTEARFAYGEFGKEPDIPPNARITYEVELLSIEDLPEFHTMTVDYRVRLSNEKRERGNMLYSRGEHSRAVDVYNRALAVVDDENEAHVESPAELRLLAETRVKCYNNLAAAQLKVEAWDAAIRSCDLVLRTDTDNVKALFRKGKCLAGKGDYEAAVLMLRRALKLEPDSRIIQQEVTRVDAKLRESNRSQKELYQKMLGTDKQPFITRKEPTTAGGRDANRRDTHWMWYVVGALSAAVIPLGFTIYRQFFYREQEEASGTAGTLELNLTDLTNTTSSSFAL